MKEEATNTFSNKQKQEVEANSQIE